MLRGMGDTSWSWGGKGCPVALVRESYGCRRSLPAQVSWSQGQVGGLAVAAR